MSHHPIVTETYLPLLVGQVSTSTRFSTPTESELSIEITNTGLTIIRVTLYPIGYWDIDRQKHYLALYSTKNTHSYRLTLSGSEYSSAEAWIRIRSHHHRI